MHNLENMGKKDYPEKLWQKIVNMMNYGKKLWTLKFLAKNDYILQGF